MDNNKFVYLVNKSLKHNDLQNGKKATFYISPIFVEVMNYGFDNLTVVQRYVYKKYVRSLVAKNKELINLGSLSRDAQHINKHYVDDGISEMTNAIGFIAEVVKFNNRFNVDIMEDKII